LVRFDPTTGRNGTIMMKSLLAPVSAKIGQAAGLKISIRCLHDAE